MNRLNRIIKVFNDYDNFIKQHSIIGVFEEKGLDSTKLEEYTELQTIRNNVSVLIGELKRYGCRREELYR